MTIYTVLNLLFLIIIYLVVECNSFIISINSINTLTWLQFNNYYITSLNIIVLDNVFMENQICRKNEIIYIKIYILKKLLFYELNNSLATCIKHIEFKLK